MPFFLFRAKRGVSLLAETGGREVTVGGWPGMLTVIYRFLLLSLGRNPECFLYVVL